MKGRENRYPGQQEDHSLHTALYSMQASKEARNCMKEYLLAPMLTVIVLFCNLIISLVNHSLYGV